MGSHNTKFFHAQTVVRRKRNKIHGLHLPLGEWCTKPDILKEQAVNFFKALFCNKEGVSNELSSTYIIKLSEEGKHALCALVTKEEVHRAVMGMKSYKAPRPDGF